jgi:hypothetical protein
MARVPAGSLVAGPVVSSGASVWARSDERGRVDIYLWRAGRVRPVATIPAPPPASGGATTLQTIRSLAFAGRTLVVAREVSRVPRFTPCPGPAPCAQPLVASPPFAADVYAGNVSSGVSHVAHVSLGRCGIHSAPVAASPDEAAWVTSSCHGSRRTCRVNSLEGVVLRACPDQIAVARKWIAYARNSDTDPVRPVHLLDRSSRTQRVLRVYFPGPLALDGNGQLTVGGSLCRSGRCRRTGDGVVMTRARGRRPHDVPRSGGSTLIAAANQRAAAVRPAAVLARACSSGSAVLVGGWRALHPVDVFGRRCGANLDITGWDGRRFAYVLGSAAESSLVLSPRVR